MGNKISVFDNFNARYSTHEEVAETFVSSDEFFQIAKNNHTFVLGPRGCGKTTMFKMLTTSALNRWNPKTLRDDELKKNFPFIAIYIPSDELWKDQLNSLLKSFQKDKELVNVISNALISNNIFTNFCESIKNHLNCTEVDEKLKLERQFCESLIDIWGLKNCTFSLSSIKLALSERRNYLIGKLNKYIFDMKFNKEQSIDLEEYFFTDFLNSIKSGIIAYENIFNKGNELKWALCFDELELISEEFYENLKSRLRIAPANIVFKLSASPLSEFDGIEAQRSHDYEVVKMWPSSHTEEKRFSNFCEQIAIQRIVSHRDKNQIKKYIDVDFAKIFGFLDYSKYALKDFNFKINVSAKENEPQSLTWFVFKELAKHDRDFRQQIIEKNIDPENPVPNNQNDSDTFIRKTKEIVINRLIFSKFQNQSFYAKRSRKEYPIYYGKESIFKLCEGNPRFIINIVNDIFIKTERYRDIDNFVFHPEEQVEVVRNVSTRFYAMLKTYPTSVIYNRKAYDLDKLIQQVGEFFEAEINQGKFKMHPQTSFFFDSKNTPTEIQKLVNIGVSLGAFIKIDKNPEDLSVDKTARYRLSYLLHPHFKLPLRLFSSIKLNNILASPSNASTNQLRFDT
jgi:energy-coupling factor transporter ATP-binding protein EcfA2